ncbi:MAG: PIN domain-containing protein [Deltaproteobacteria bacterium]|nr:PIN domain-containing protein [Deltaproteobacteria bacterium]
MEPLAFPLAVFFDSDVMIAGSASCSGASFALLQLAELRLINGYISGQVFEECRRNLSSKLPEAIAPFEQIVARCVTSRNVSPSRTFLTAASNQADPKDVSILASALEVGARFLVTFNIRHYWTSPTTPIAVLTPGDLLQRIRSVLSRLGT